MSELEKLTAEIRRATDYQVNKKILREKNQTDLHFAHAGGLFKATPELIAFIHAWRSTNEVWEWEGGTDVYLEDTYGNPIYIEDCAAFYRTACEHYQQVMNDWHQQHEELKKIRKV